ncbi:hypothetical protein CK203_039418 [Vitis vinifera]|uniref:Integrase catalytic domain-containing protein n=1 Tax=Vitis vinifera TaxID=29760 RepID=A0A438I769_VITVI|nr:hypothetical protein CK203_039418 [Vitis vinifera]
MVETSRDWSEKLFFALWAYRTSFHTSIGATPSLVYDMEAVLPVEDRDGFIESSSQTIPENGFGFEDSQGLVGDPIGKFRPSWSRPYVVRELTPEGAAWLTDLDGNQFLEPTNVGQLKKYYV